MYIPLLLDELLTDKERNLLSPVAEKNKHARAHRKVVAEQLRKEAAALEAGVEPE